MSEEAPDILQQITSKLTLSHLLDDPRATGKGVKVCVIDSGIDRPTIADRCLGRQQPIPEIQGGIFLAGNSEPLPYEGQPSTPHGTTVADIILPIAPEIELFSADVFGPQGTSEIECVLRALHWAIHVWKCKVINLSLGVTEQRLQPVQRRNQMMRAIEDGYFQDVLLVAAAHHDHPFERRYPAVLSPPLLSVDKGDFSSQHGFLYHLREKVEFQAYSRGYCGPFADEPATSWAAPHLSGLVACLCSLRPGLKPFEAKTLLYWMSQEPTSES